VLSDPGQLVLDEREHVAGAEHGVVSAEQVELPRPVVWKLGIDLAGRCRSGGSAEADGGCGARADQATTAGWLHVFSRVAVSLTA
jgi:hypothetical protein